MVQNEKKIITTFIMSRFWETCLYVWDPFERGLACDVSLLLVINIRFQINMFQKKQKNLLTPLKEKQY